MKDFFFRKSAEHMEYALFTFFFERLPDVLKYLDICDSWQNLAGEVMTTCFK